MDLWLIRNSLRMYGMISLRVIISAACALETIMPISYVAKEASNLSGSRVYREVPTTEDNYDAF